jgi:hypothetical protein
MSLPNVRPVNEWTVDSYCSSIGATPAAISVVAPVKGRIVRTLAVSNGTTTGTIAIAVGINAGSDIGAGALAIAAGSGGVAAEDFPANAGGNAQVNEGDVVTFTPSGGGGSNVPGWFCAVIREA